MTHELGEKAQPTTAANQHVVQPHRRECCLSSGPDIPDWGNNRALSEFESNFTRRGNDTRDNWSGSHVTIGLGPFSWWARSTWTIANLDNWVQLYWGKSKRLFTNRLLRSPGQTVENVLKRRKWKGGEKYGIHDCPASFRCTVFCGIWDENL